MLNFSLLIFVLLVGCGQNQSSISLIRDKSDRDVGVAHLKTLFASSAAIVDSPDSLSTLKLGRERNCVMMEATRGRLQTSFLSQRLVKFSGLIKSEITFDEGTQIQTMAFIDERGLSTLIATAPNYALVSPAQIYFRATADGRLISEWTIDGEELLRSPGTSRASSLVRANLLLDPAFADPQRFALLYAVCE